MSAWSSQSKNAADAVPASLSGDVYHHPIGIAEKLGAKYVKIYFSGTVWQLLELISNNMPMVNLMVNFHPKIVYPLPIKWIKSSCTIEWE